MQKDEVHVPPLRAEVEKKLPWTVRQALSQFLKSVLLGWPAYLLWNASSNKSRKGRVNHFEPNSPLFKGSEKSQIILSDAALAVVIAILIYIGSQIGGAMLFKMYFLPYFHVNFWLVLITKLQHSEKNVPFWGQQEWTWLRGQLTTIDRSYGKFLDVYVPLVRNLNLH
jgi:omega-6 fatty acid desaturase (delta-12 desaturase)